MMKYPLVQSKVTLLAGPVPTLLHRAEDSCDEEDRADDMDREEEAQEHATNVAVGASVPDLFRNRQTRYIHVIADEAGDRFRCGRTLSEADTQLSSEPRFCTPQCKQCFKKR